MYLRKLFVQFTKSSMTTLVSLIGFAVYRGRALEGIYVNCQVITPLKAIRTLNLFDFQLVFKNMYTGVSKTALFLVLLLLVEISFSVEGFIVLHHGIRQRKKKINTNKKLQLQNKVLPQQQKLKPKKFKKDFRVPGSWGLKVSKIKLAAFKNFMVD